MPRALLSIAGRWALMLTLDLSVRCPEVAAFSFDDLASLRRVFIRGEDVEHRDRSALEVRTNIIMRESGELNREDPNCLIKVGSRS